MTEQTPPQQGDLHLLISYSSGAIPEGIGEMEPRQVLVASMTARQRAISDLTKLPNSVGVLVFATKPQSLNFFAASGDPSVLCKAEWMR